jgi:CHASE3 domain sensor protein
MAKHFLWSAFQAMLEAGKTTSEARNALQTLFPQYTEDAIVRVLDNMGDIEKAEANYSANEFNKTLRAQANRGRSRLTAIISDDEATGAMLEGAPGLNELIRRAAGRG